MENNEVIFDILKIDANIKKDNVYKEGENKFQFCNGYNPDNQSEKEQNLDIPKYIAKITSNSFKYLGILSKNLNKESYGYYCYESGDEYFGQWNKDKKEGYGIYYFKEKDDEEIKQIYLGEFKNNLKSGEGIYFHISKLAQEQDIYIPLDFSLAIGKFTNDNFNKGTILSIKDGKRKLYKGKIGKDGQKSDDNAELYEDTDKIFHGKFENNEMIEGRIINVKEGIKENGYYFEKKKDEDDISLNYEKWEKDDNKYVNLLNVINELFEYSKIKDLFIKIL